MLSRRFSGVLWLSLMLLSLQLRVGAQQAEIVVPIVGGVYVDAAGVLQTVMVGDPDHLLNNLRRGVPHSSGDRCCVEQGGASARFAGPAGPRSPGTHPSRQCNPRRSAICRGAAADSASLCLPRGAGPGNRRAGGGVGDGCDGASGWTWYSAAGVAAR